jgi:hypothetical protein
MPAPPYYNIQCILHGYAGRATEKYTPELYAQCQQRDAQGFIDALCLGPGNDFCGQCQEDKEKRRASDLSYLEQIQDPTSLWYIDNNQERAERVKEIREELGLPRLPHHHRQRTL